MIGPVTGIVVIKRSLAGLALLAVLSIGASMPATTACAQAGDCTQACQAQFARCYKDTGSNRKVCEAQLQQCLSTCIAKR